MLKVFKFYLFPFILGGDEDQQTPPDDQEGDPALPKADEVLDIKQNYVSKEEHNRLIKEYKKLVSSVLDGSELPADLNPNGEEAQDIAKLKKELYDPNNSLSNLDYVSKTLQLREAIIKETGKDPFLPTGINGDPFKTDAERDNAVAAAQKVAKVLKEAVDEANGDSGTFDIILSKIII